MTPKEVLALIRREDLRAVDLRFMDFTGAAKHFTVPAEALTERRFEDGFPFKASSLPGWQSINESDLLVVPVPETAAVDPFHNATLAVTCNIQDPVTRGDYPRDPRGVARKAESYMRATGAADACLIGAEVEFFVFDDIEFSHTASGASYQVRSGGTLRGGEGYLAVPPADGLQDLRTEIMHSLTASGIGVLGQHHEVAPGQCGVELDDAPLLTAADRLHRLKSIVRNLASARECRATFMPKPLFNEHGSGLHLTLSLLLNEKPLFAGSGYGGLSEEAMHALGGVLAHADALAAFCCPTTNSYKRLVPGHEAPVNRTYSFRNRSAAVRVPAESASGDRPGFEFRLPDPSCNPYLATAAVLMAMLDGLENRTDPGPPLDKDIYDLEPAELRGVPNVPSSLDGALAALEHDREFLLRGDVFTEDVINTWVAFKREHEVAAIAERPHPWEFALYFDA